MRLNKVELFGFKSFADKTSFDFSAGITAILGPNGCGKSNVVDAVKWVLGEQNARNLRGSEMADVIFAGSERRKPMGMAEVSLYFDNADGRLPTEYNEVCVTRRLYRSGESEYLINKQRCRLRDVKNLFLDTGIGTNAYSYIEQGRVEALLSAKPHDRRAVFEEAAGISKYKVRRKETLARLERTEQYLARVNDIAEEIEKRVRSVARQAQGARRYERLTAELRFSRGRLYATRWEEETTRRDGIAARRAEIGELQRQEEARHALLAGAIAERQQTELELERLLAESDGSLLALQRQIAGCEATSARLQERIHGLEKEAAAAREAAADHRLREGVLGEERNRTGSLLSSLEEELQELVPASDRLGAQQRAAQERSAELEVRLEEAQQALSALQEERNALTALRVRLESDAESIAQQRAALLQRREAQALRRTGLLAARAAATHEAESLAREEEALRARLAEERSRIETAREETQAASARLAEIERERATRESRLHTLQELEANLAGVQRGAKAVLEAARAGRAEGAGIEGLVAERLVAREDAALAVETSLGAAQHFLIARTAQDARRSVDFLKRESAGRATFLPLDRIRPRARADHALLSGAGVVGEAIDLVRFAESDRPAAEYLLAGTLVLASLDQALALQAGAGRGVRMVTLEGELVSPSGAITGGREQHAKGGLVTRRSEIESLEAALAVYPERIEAARRERDAAQARIAACAGALTEREPVLAELQRRRRDAAGALAARAAEMERLEIEEGELGQELERLQERLVRTGEEEARAAANAAAFTGRESAAAETLRELSPRRAELRRAAEAEAERLAALRVTLAEKTQRQEHAAARLVEIEREAEQSRIRAEQDAAKAAAADEERQRIEAELAQTRETLGGLLSQQSGAAGQSDELRQRLGTERAELEARRAEERAITRRLSDIQTSLGELNVQEREATLRLEATRERAREELGIEDLDAFRAELAARRARETGEEDAGPEEEEVGEEEDFIPEADLDALSPAELERHVHELQERIRRIGPVNHQAVEELAELKARREFLIRERDDLAAARADLTALFDRLNLECRQRFDETFVAVRENFQLMFRRLFGGGKADLVLEENEDPLNAGIEIIARPPGKEPKSISLLSGGEKALCAVALLFSIFRSKPSPFCILDEVDGPLDESNIVRFMETVKDFSAESQFVIITHSKRTMAMVDLIYGVTQSEPGISRKMSLKFSDGETKSSAAADVA